MLIPCEVLSKHSLDRSLKEDKMDYKELLKSAAFKKWLYYASLIIFAGLVLHIVLGVHLNYLNVGAHVSGYVSTD